MAEDMKIVAVTQKPNKPNPHGGELTPFYLTVQPSSGGPALTEVYSQRKPPNVFTEGETVFARIETGDYGPRLYLEQREDGAPSGPQAGGADYSRSAYAPQPSMSKDDYWRRKDERDVASQARMGRAHAQEMSIMAHELLGIRDRPIKDSLIEMADFFQEDVLRFPLVDGGGGAGASEVREGPVGHVRQIPVIPTSPSPSAEASPAQKGKLTTLFGQAGLAKDAQKAIVYFRCKQEKATKDGASLLIKDLLEGATAEQLLAEIGDAAGAGDPVAHESLKLLPPNAPLTEVVDYTEAEGKDDSGVPF